MQILCDHEVPDREDLRAYRQLAWPHLGWSLLFAGLSLGVAALPILTGTWTLIWVDALCAAGALLYGGLAALGLRAFRASLLPSNRLLRWSRDGLYLRFRSCFNHRFPADTASIVFLERGEIAWLRRYVEAFDGPDEHGSWSILHRQQGLEIGLRRVDTTPLAKALAQEAKLRDAKGARTNHYPVTLNRDGHIRVELKRPQDLLDELGKLFPLRQSSEPPAARFESLSFADQEDHILGLALSGKTIAAVAAARELYGCDITEAKKLVEGMVGR